MEAVKQTGFPNVGRALPADKVNGDMSMMAPITKPPTYTGGPMADGGIYEFEPIDSKP